MKLKRYTKFLSLLCGVLCAACSSQGYMSTDDPDVLYDRAMKYYEEEKWGRASRYFESAMVDLLGTDREDSLAFYNSKCKFKSEDYLTAISYFDLYRRQFSRSQFLEDAEGMLTLSYYYISLGPERDPTNIYQALSSIDEFKSRYPRSNKNEAFAEIKIELINRLYDRAFLNAYTYYKTGYYKAAIVAFRNAIKEFPDSHNREKTMYYMVSSAYELARNSVPSKEEDRYFALIDMYYTFIADYPESEYRPEVESMHKAAREFLENSNPDLLKESTGEGAII